jgi:hypothetical protein
MTKATSETTILPLLALLHILHSAGSLLNLLLHLPLVRHLRIDGHVLLLDVFGTGCSGFVYGDWCQHLLDPIRLVEREKRRRE